MIRTSKHNLSQYGNEGKLAYLHILFNDYKSDLDYYISLIINGTLPLKMKMSSALLPINIIKHSKYRRDIYIKASEIIRSQLKQCSDKRYHTYKKIYKYFKDNNRQLSFLNKKYSELNIKDIIKSRYFTTPVINNVSISLTNELFNIKYDSSFDNMIKIILPYFNGKGTRALNIKLPFNNHRHSLKLHNNGFKLRNTIQLKCVNGKYIISLFWEKEVILKNEGTSLGIDFGVNKLIATSNSDIIGIEMCKMYNKINGKQRGSKAFKRALVERNNLTNYYINKLNIDNISTIIIEDLKNVKYKKSYNELKKKNKVKYNKDKQTAINEKNSRWLYPLIINKIQMICEDNGISVVKVSPCYTSQTCSSCGAIHEESRNGANYKCIDCGYTIDADYNAAINIHNRGVYSLSIQKA